jgi:hypothetical protein
MIVKCDYCGKELFETDEKRRGVIASIAMRKRFIAKNYIAFGNPGFRIFCCVECKNSWFSENIPKDKVKQGEKFVKELSDKFRSKEFQTPLIKGLQRIQQLIKKYKNE